jgi:3-deoxy-7-phosphoheptulonate synthase
MIIILNAQATDRNREDIIANLKQRGFGIHLSQGVEKTIIGVIGAMDEQKAEIAEQFEALPFVERCIPISQPYKLVGKSFRPEGSTIDVRGVIIGGGHTTVMAGPCTVETEEQLMTTARIVKAAGAHILRGGAYKPSTSPYSFHGHGVSALKMLAAAREETGMPIITEVMDARDLEVVCEYADILQIGTRNALNYTLLREVGNTRTPVMLKRGMSSKIEEWLQAAEYIAQGGNYQIMLCERGIRTFETYTRNTFDINAIPALKELTHLPVIADPSHGTGKASLVNAVTKASLVAGADGVIVEVHPNPAKALKDGAQSLTPESFEELMGDLRKLAAAVGRSLV